MISAGKLLRFLVSVLDRMSFLSIASLSTCDDGHGTRYVEAAETIQGWLAKSVKAIWRVLASSRKRY